MASLHTVGRMTDESSQPPCGEIENFSPKSKSKKSKKWRKKSNRGETSGSPSHIGENKQAQFDLAGKECDKKREKASRMSLKGRIKKMSLRKTSKIEKRNVSSNEKVEDEEQGKEQEQLKATKLTGYHDEEHEHVATIESKSEMGYINSNEAEEELTQHDELSDEVNVEGESFQNVEVDNKFEFKKVEMCHEMPCEIEQSEDNERKKSKANFDAVIVELGCKEVQLTNELVAMESVDNDVHDISGEEKFPALELNEVEEKNSSNQEEKITNTNESSQITIEEDFKKVQEESGNGFATDNSSQSRSNESKHENTECQSNIVQHEHHNEEMKKKLDIGLESKGEFQKKRTLQQIKNDETEISQKVTRKAVGKVVGRYRQAQLTKTYCQCCSLM